jgi:hypothetical protein
MMPPIPILFLSAIAFAGNDDPPSPLPLRGIYGGYPTALITPERPLAHSGVNAIWVGSDSLDPAQVKTFHDQGARVFAEFNTLHAAGYLKDHPDAAPIGPDGKASPPPDGWQGICPTHPDYRRARMAAFRKALADFEIDGIWLDYHHAHASWEQAEPNLPDTCFCPRCLAAFDQFTGLALAALPFRMTVHEIQEHLQARWVEFRCGILTDWIREFKAIRDEVRPQALLGVFHCPWTSDERDGALQKKLFIDLRAWKPFIDVYSPMPYHARFGHAQDLEWIARQTQWLGDHLEIKGKPDERVKIWPIVQISNWGEDVPPADVERIIALGATPPSTGILAFAWGGFANDPAKLESLTRAYQRLATANR